ncbi:hypothetical protein [Flammeovirga sp. SJP92]|uniref:hypothetical protein n=1 Tax=Flammeovirga sp. SJP92 TaxID=1775430 RepID=UPI0007890179|nr:hypothetical protein [Flammeovirga sp. SJP92]KXX71401.1 hypothetical protein AVL50_05730 [Flammeovirga sp. SJP92]
MKSKMKVIITWFIILLNTVAYAQVENVNEKWLVILSGADNLQDAVLSQKRYDFKTQILNSSVYDNLNPGWYINVLTHETQQQAKAQSKDLNQQGFKSYVKYSGKYKDTDAYILDNHFIIMGGKYMLTTFEVDEVTEVIGYEGVEVEAFLVKAKFDQKKLPAQLSYLRGKDFVVYDRDGRQTKAKIEEFLAVNIATPYWGYIVRWQNENWSEIDIAKELMSTGRMTIAAKLDLDPDMEGAVAHLQNDFHFTWNTEGEDDDITEEAFQKLMHHPKMTEYDSLLVQSMKKLEDDYDPPKPPIDKQSKQLTLGDTTFVFMNVIYGDYCYFQQDGLFYTNVFAVWNNKSDTIDFIDDFEELAHFEFSPFYINGTTHNILGFVNKNYGGISTYLKYPDWKSYKMYGGGVTGCD